eukprot:1157459-Pelagomonas_calceolata.AAC.12
MLSDGSCKLDKGCLRGLGNKALADAPSWVFADSKVRSAPPDCVLTAVAGRCCWWDGGGGGSRVCSTTPEAALVVGGKAAGRAEPGGCDAWARAPSGPSSPGTADRP